MKNDMARADKALGIAEQNIKQIEEIKVLLQNPNITARARRSLERKLSELRGN
jgi:hypothetical protein